MSTRILKREELAQKLRDWAAGRASSEEVLRWADALYPSDDVDYEDWEGDDDSVTNEVLAALDMLDMNLALPEDAGIYLEFLSTPLGQFRQGYERYMGTGRGQNRLFSLGACAGEKLVDAPAPFSMRRWSSQPPAECPFKPKRNGLS